MMPSPTDRIIILVDMDCFYCQVEEGLDLKLKGKPIAIVQYNQWQGGGIIAVNYLARDQGVTRHMRGAEAKEKCCDLQLVSVPTKRGKADTSRYRNAGKRVAEVLQTFTSSLERASVDEAYLDVTEQIHERINTASARITEEQLQSTHIIGFDNVKNFLEEVYDTELSNDVNIRLAIGAAIAEDIRAAVFAKTGYRCSAGIAHNKILAKLVCGLHKPNQQTVLPQEGVPELYEKLPVRKIQSLGGKFGANVTDALKVEYVGELARFSEKELKQHFDDKTSHWLYWLARGIENSPVTTRLRSQSIGCCKKFPGPSALTSMADLRPWLEDLVAELHERLAEDRAEYKRRARHLVVNVSYIPLAIWKAKSKPARSDEVSQSRSTQMVADWDTADGTRTTDEFLSILRKCGALPPTTKDDETKEFSVRFLGLSAGKFEDIKNQTSISAFLSSKTILKENCVDKINIDTNLEINNVVVSENKTNSRNSPSILKNIGKQSCTKTPTNNLKKAPTKSFFLNYFQSVEHNSPRSNKNAITSVETHINDTSTNIVKESVINEGPSHENDIPSKTICPECNKPINLNAIQNHLDYHYAIKIVREESHMYKNIVPTQQPTTSVSKIVESTKKKAVKRKSSETVNSKSIDSFFIGKKNKLDPSNLKECSECGKTILDADFETHTDFHLAKKLCSEINASTKSECNTSIRNKEKIKTKKRKCDTRSVSTYFKAE